MATYAENIAAVEALEAEIATIRDNAESSINAKNEQIGVITAEALAQEQACGHESWTKVDGEWAVTCDSCEKRVEFSSPTVLWPWAT